MRNWLRKKHWLHTWIFFSSETTPEQQRVMRICHYPETLIRNNWHRMCRVCDRVQVADIDGWCDFVEQKDADFMREKLKAVL